MRRDEGSRKTVLYRKLICVFFLALIPFFLLSLLTNQIAERRLSEQSQARMIGRIHNAVEEYQEIYLNISSWMKINLMNGYKTLLANDQVTLSSYRLGQLVSELYTDIQESTQISDEIEDIAVFMPRTGRKVSLKEYYAGALTAEEKQRIQAYHDEPNYFVFVQDAFRIQSSSLQYGNQESAYIIEVTLSKEELLNNLNNGEQESYGVVSLQQVLAGNQQDDALLESIRKEILKDDLPSRQLCLEGYQICYEQLINPSFFLVSYVPMATLLDPVRSFNYFSLITLLLAALCSTVVCTYLYRAINRPLQALMDMFGQVEQGNMHVVMDAAKPMRGEFSLIFERFRAMLEQLQCLITKSIEQESALRQAEYRNLKAHIAPHFLYNSFNVLRYSIRMGDLDTAEQMVAHLGNYFRYLSYMDTKEDISLQEEYRHVMDYLAIQKLRFQDNVQYEMDELPEQFAQMRIPPFTLQPLMENIFKHGINDVAYSGRICMKITQHGPWLRITVRDNGAGMDAEALQRLRSAMQEGTSLDQHTGLVHVCQRLRYYFKDRCNVQVNSEPGAYFEVQMDLPR